MSNNNSMQVVNPFEPQASQSDGGAMQQATSARSMSEVQMQVMLAKQFPRNQHEAVNRIIAACKRPKLAEQATYSYYRGGDVSGPSIRLAEAVAQAWGNLEFGVREIERGDGESVAESFCWDLETNTRQSKTFTVPHTRTSKSKGTYEVTAPRDIYEVIANQAARRLRACILGIIPGDVIDTALEQCRVTRRLQDENAGEGPAELLRKMVLGFSELGVGAKALEDYLGHDLDATTLDELDQLRGVYRAIKDNYASRADYFPGQFGRAGAQGGASDLNQTINQAAADGGQPAAPPAPKAQQYQPEQTQQQPAEADQPAPAATQQPTAAEQPPKQQQQPQGGAAERARQAAKQPREVEQPPVEVPATELLTKGQGGHDFSSEPDWVTAKKRLAALIGHAGGDKSLRERYYTRMCANYAVSGTENLPPYVLQNEADALGEHSPSGGDNGEMTRREYMELVVARKIKPAVISN